jgi:hypothetical protein
MMVRLKAVIAKLFSGSRANSSIMAVTCVSECLDAYEAPRSGRFSGGSRDIPKIAFINDRERVWCTSVVKYESSTGPSIASTVFSFVCIEVGQCGCIDLLASPPPVLVISV